jgi:hypothetical protein
MAGKQLKWPPHPAARTPPGINSENKNQKNERETYA